MLYEVLTGLQCVKVDVGHVAGHMHERRFAETVIGYQLEGRVDCADCHDVGGYRNALLKPPAWRFAEPLEADFVCFQPQLRCGAGGSNAAASSLL